MRADDNWLYVGQRKWWGERNNEDADLSEAMGRPYHYHRRQFVVRFESGWSVSVIWGSMTYSDNHDHLINDGHPFVEEPQRVEAAVLHKDRDGVNGDVLSYMDVEALNSLLDFVSKLATNARPVFGEVDRAELWTYDGSQ